MATEYKEITLQQLIKLAALEVTHDRMGCWAIYEDGKLFQLQVGEACLMLDYDEVEIEPLTRPDAVNEGIRSVDQAQSAVKSDTTRQAFYGNALEREPHLNTDATNDRLWDENRRAYLNFINSNKDA